MLHDDCFDFLRGVEDTAEAERIKELAAGFRENACRYTQPPLRLIYDQTVTEQIVHTVDRFMEDQITMDTLREELETLMHAAH